LTYTDTKNEIISALQLVTGIGKVYASMKQTVDLKTLNSVAVTDGKFNLCYVSRLSVQEDGESGIGSRDETDEDIVKQVIETWNITMFYAYKDNDSTPSEFAFQLLVDAVREKFRWLQNLGGQAYKSYSAQVITANIFDQQNATVLCHRADIKLTVKYRLLGTGEETGEIIPPTGLVFRRGTDTILSAGTEVSFIDVGTTDYDLLISSCVDADGVAVGVDIPSNEYATNHFHAYPSVDATLKWILIKI
jgi:hypothetical protein